MPEIDKGTLEKARFAHSTSLREQGLFGIAIGDAPVSGFRTAMEAAITAYLEHLWRDMGSAPLDGRHVLLACDVDPPKGFVCEGYYDGVSKTWHEANHHYTDSWGDPVTPIKWQPLPRPPK